ncbi:MAG: efflux RND transporter periplasmic adaptor subunit [Pseudomonadota bacterium]
MDTEPRKTPGRTFKSLLKTGVSHVLNGMKVLIFAGIAVAGIGAGVTIIQERSDARATVAPSDPILVETIRAAAQDSFSRMTSYAGLIEPARTSALAFERAGTLLDVTVDEGDLVKTGDVIATLDTRALETRKRELQARKTALTAQRDLALITTERRRELSKDGWSTDQAFDEARHDVMRLDASINEVEAALSGVDVDLDKSIVKAPFDGRIAARRLDEGAIVSSGAALVDLMETSKPQLRVGFPQARANSLKIGKTYDVLIDGVVVKARLHTLRPDIDPATRSLIALFNLPSNGTYRFGAIADVTIETKDDRDGFWLPVTALKEGSRGLWTIMTVLNGKAQLESVEVLTSDGDRAFVRGTLTDGAEVIVNGNHRLVPGTLVTASADKDA